MYKPSGKPGALMVTALKTGKKIRVLRDMVPFLISYCNFIRLEDLIRNNQMLYRNMILIKVTMNCCG